MLRVKNCISIVLVLILTLGAVFVPSSLFANEYNESQLTSLDDNGEASRGEVPSSETSDGGVEGSSQPEPEYNVSVDATANSFRFSNGCLIDGADTESDNESSGIMTMSIDFSTGGNTWTKNGDTYNATGTDGSIGMTVTGAKGFGIDVSSWQNEIDWSAVKRSGIVDYAIIRCGWGDDIRSQDDRQFLNNVRGCLNNGIPFGIYIYSYAYNTTMAQSEASHVLRLLKEAGLNPSKVAYPIYLDLEQQDQSGRPAGMNDGKYHTVNNQMLERIAITFCTAIEDAGYTPGIYANKTWWNNYLSGGVYKQWTKWVAQYNTTCTYNGDYDAWQCMSNGRIDGIDGNVDINFDFSGLPEIVKTYQASDASRAMYRLYNPYSGEHLYTQNVLELNTLCNIGWIYEGFSWSTPNKSAKPVYRLYNPNNGDHHYTMSTNECNVLSSIGWHYEGVCWYSDQSESQPIYRLFNPNQLSAGSHHYTPSINERDTLSKMGWIPEGIAWYGA